MNQRAKKMEKKIMANKMFSLKLKMDSGLGSGE